MASTAALCNITKQQRQRFTQHTIDYHNGNLRSSCISIQETQTFAIMLDSLSICSCPLLPSTALLWLTAQPSKPGLSLLCGFILHHPSSSGWPCCAGRVYWSLGWETHLRDLSLRARWVGEAGPLPSHFHKVVNASPISLVLVFTNLKKCWLYTAQNK